VTTAHCISSYALVKPITNNANVEIIAATYSLKTSFGADRVAAIKMTATQIRTMVENTDTYFMYIYDITYP